MSSLANRWAAAVDGDRVAFEDFYRRHSDRVFRHLYRRTQSREDARDLTTEVFVLAWLRRDTVAYSEFDDIAPWLLTTATNLSRNHLRARAREDFYLNHARHALLPAADGDIDAVVDNYASQQEALRVMRVLEGLRRQDQDIIELCVIEGLAPSDVAKQAGVPAAIVRGRLHRALRRARRAWSALPSVKQPGSGGGAE